MAKTPALILVLLSCLFLHLTGFAQGGSGQQGATRLPSVYDHGFRISYPDRVIFIGGAEIKAKTADETGAARESGLYLVLLNEAGQPDAAVFSTDFNELLRTYTDRMVIGISIQSPDSEYGDQYFVGRLKPDLTGLTIADFAGDVHIAPGKLQFPPRSNSVSTSSQSLFRMGRVAHAGGALGNITYTNSYQALDENIAKGFEYFEIDFVFTSDGHLVCLHDWDVNFERTFGFANSAPLSMAGFEDLVAANPRFQNCTLDGLADWMRENPGAYLVTDVKDDNLLALDLIRNSLPDAGRRVIPQIYNAAEHAPVKAMGFDQIIWTLYRIAPSDLEVLNQVAAWEGPVAVTMPKAWADSGLGLLLQARGVPAFAHTVNSVEELERLTREFGFTEIYTDFLVPLQNTVETP